MFVHTHMRIHLWVRRIDRISQFINHVQCNMADWCDSAFGHITHTPIIYQQIRCSHVTICNPDVYDYSSIFDVLSTPNCISILYTEIHSVSKGKYKHTPYSTGNMVILAQHGSYIILSQSNTVRALQVNW